MLFYIAGKWTLRDKVRYVIDSLEVMGHKVTVDWTYHEEDDPGFPLGYALEDIDGVRDCQVYVGIFEEDVGYKGALVEFGVALGLGKQCYIVGHAIDSCIFVNHPLVRQLDSVKEFLDYVRRLL